MRVRNVVICWPPLVWTCRVWPPSAEMSSLASNPLFIGRLWSAPPVLACPRPKVSLTANFCTSTQGCGSAFMFSGSSCFFNVDPIPTLKVKDHGAGPTLNVEIKLQLLRYQFPWIYSFVSPIFPSLIRIRIHCPACTVYKQAAIIFLFFGVF